MSRNSGRFKFLEPQRLVQVCSGVACSTYSFEQVLAYDLAGFRGLIYQMTVLF